MGDLFKYSEISRLAAEIYTDKENNLTWKEALEKAKKIWGSENEN